MKKRALIGYTGFVGANLQQQSDYDCLYNSKNIDEMRGQHYDEVVCAGVSAVKWKANKDPEGDWQGIRNLLDVLESVQADRFTLISTIDVYADPAGYDESFDCHSKKNHAYGTHRLAVEDFCNEHFENNFVVRLPGLFGAGLKKNIIFDLLHDNCLEMINSQCSFQYYDLKHLWEDIQAMHSKGIRLANFFTAPVGSSEILERFFPGKSVGSNAGPEAHYNLKTIHADLRGRGDRSYLYSKEEVLEDMATFIDAFKKGGDR